MKKTARLSMKLLEALYGEEVAYLNENVNEGNVNSLDRDGRTMLFHAVLENLSKLIPFLIKKGADVNVHDKYGWCALHFAALTQNKNIAKLLVDNGAEIDAQEENGNTPLSTAVFESQGKGETIKYLLKAGANPSKKNYHGVSPKSLAKTIANYDVHKFFKQ